MRKSRKTVKRWSFIVFGFLILIFSLHEFRLGASAAEWFARRLSTESIVFSCADIRLGLLRGLKVDKLKVFDLTREDKTESMFSADSIRISPFRRKVTVVNPVFPHLGDSYYRPGAPNPSGNEIVHEFRLKRFPHFTLEMVGGNILGIAPRMLTARVSIGARKILFDEINLEWDDPDPQMNLLGKCLVDFEHARVAGGVDGYARQENIRPLLVHETLDMPIAVTYMDAFEGVTAPVKAFCGWDVNLLDCSFTIDLKIEPRAGRFNTVPFTRGDGEIHIAVNFDGGFMNYVTTIGPVHAFSGSKKILDGTISFIGTNGTDHVEFDAESFLGKVSTLKVIDELNDGILDCFDYHPPSSVSVSGELFPDIENQSCNDLGGRIAFASGSLFGIPLTNATARYAYVGDKIFFTEAKASGNFGGELSGGGSIAVPGLVEENARFDVELDYVHGSVAEVAEAFDYPLGDRHGEVSCHLRLMGPMGSNCVSHLNGLSHLEIREGNLAQLKLFNGFTDYFSHIFAKELSIETIRATEATADFTIENGIVKSENVLIEGMLFSIKAEGSYDLVNDRLDFHGQVRLLNSGNPAAYIIHPVLVVVTSLLAEFKVEGPIDDPVWSYYGPLDKLKGVFK